MITVRGLRWHFLTAGLVLAAWTVVYLAVITFAPPAYDPEHETAAKVNFGMAVILFIPTVVHVVAALVLLHFWLAGAGARLSKLDPAERVLAMAVATLPEHRRVWGAAMVGELAEVQGRSARWWFALSCVRAALLPRPGSWSVLALVAGVAVAATVAAAPAVGAAVPGLDVFAISFVGLASALAVLAVARSRRLRFEAPAPAILVVGAVTAAIAMTTIFLYREPSAAEFLSPFDAVLIAVVSAGSLWVALASPRALGPSRIAPRLGAGAALAFVIGQLLLGRMLNLDPRLEPLQFTGALLLVFGPGLLFFVPAFWAAWADRSLRSGLKAGAWTAISFLPLSLAVWLFESLRIYASTGRLIIDTDPGPIGANIDQSVFWCLMYVPVMGIPAAVFGAAIAAYVAPAIEPELGASR